MKNTYTLIAVDRKRRARRRNVQKFFKKFLRSFDNVAVMFCLSLFICAWVAVLAINIQMGNI